MLSLHRFLISSFVFFCVINDGLFKELPDYIHVCKRDASTINDCSIQSIEALKEKLIKGIPELHLPSLEPFFIKEIKALTAENLPVHASGHNINVTGASNFLIKSMSVDLDTLKIKVNLRFPKVHIEGSYKMVSDAQILPLNGEGMLKVDAVKCDALLVIHTQTYTKDGQEYVRVRKIDADIKVEDYKIKLDGIFKGEKALGIATNQLLNQNRGESYKLIKPHLEKTIAAHVLDIANKILDGLPLSQLLLDP